MIQRFVAGLISQPHGLDGMVKVRSLSGEMDHLAKLEHVCVRLAGHEKIYTIEKTHGSSHLLLMKFRGIDSPEAAKALGGAELLVDREAAAPLEAEEYYVEDLKGLSVVAAGRGEEAIGTIHDVIEGGGGNLVEIRLASGACRLVPFRKEFFGEVDPAKNRAVLLEEWILGEAAGKEEAGGKR